MPLSPSPSFLHVIIRATEKCPVSLLAMVERAAQQVQWLLPGLNRMAASFRINLMSKIPIAVWYDVKLNLLVLGRAF